MPYQYLNSQGLWGDTAEGIGNAFNNAVVGLTRLRMQQGQQAQQSAMDRAYLDLAVRQLGQQKELKGQELSAEAPVNAARVGLMQAQTKSAGIDSEAQQRAMQVQQRNQGLGDVAGNAQRVLQAIMNPVSDKMPFQGVPYKMGEANPAATQQVPISPELRQQLGPQTQFNQQSMQNALQGIIQQAAMQALFSGQQGATAIPQGVSMTQAGPAAMLPTPRQTDPTMGMLRSLAPLARPDPRTGQTSPVNVEAQQAIMRLLQGQQPQSQGEAEPQGATTSELGLERRIKVKAKDGTIGNIPESQRAEAEAEGYTILEGQ